MTSVLVVDDEESYREMVAESLREVGLDVVVACDANEALDALASRPFDLLLTDLRLGDRDGMYLIEAARTVAPATRPILMSAYATARDVQRALALGAVSVLAKPFSPDELIRAIDQTVECGTGFHGSVHGIALTDMLQLFHMAHRSVAISVAGEVSGTIHMRDGEVVHAQVEGDLEDEAAFRRLLAAHAGALQTSSLGGDVPRSMNRGFQDLLMDSLRILDEEAAGAAAAVSAEPAYAGHPLERNEPMSNLKESLARLQEIDGCLGSCVVDSNSGMMLGSAGVGVNLEVAAAGNTEVVRAKRKTIKLLGLMDQIEDILITLGRQYHVLRPLTSNDALFLYVVLEKSRANLAMARHTIASVEKELLVG